jgi:hypothetical protein
VSDDIQKDIEARGLDAPRVRPADVEAEIADEFYFTASDGVSGCLSARTQILKAQPVALGLLTFCVLVLRNGFTVTGESACASLENFDADIGRRVARQNALNKVWPLLGFRLRDQLSIEQSMRDFEDPTP